MDDNYLNSVADMIWSSLNTIDNQDIGRSEQTLLIKGIIMHEFAYNRSIGKKQAINFIKDSISALEK